MLTVSDARVKVVRKGRQKPALGLPLTPENGGLPEPEYRSLAERVAGHRLYQRGVSIGALREAFPTSKFMWTVSRYFPYSKHGPLYIDEPVLAPEVEESKRKKKVLEKLGLKVIILGPGVTYQQAMEQLAETSWLGQSQQP